MKKGLTEIVFIIDESGSMFSLTKDTIGGFNSVLANQRDSEGEALVSTVLFNTECRVLHDRVPIGQVAEMTENDYRAGGCTALLDAIGGAVKHISTIHRYARPEDVPEHTLFVITTDGMENSSREYGADKVRAMISERQANGWEFIFLGANIDAAATAGSMGIEHASNYKADESGTRLMYGAVNKAVRCMRKFAPMPADWNAEMEEDAKR